MSKDKDRVRQIKEQQTAFEGQGKVCTYSLMRTCVCVCVYVPMVEDVGPYYYALYMHAYVQSSMIGACMYSRKDVYRRSESSIYSMTCEWCTPHSHSQELTRLQSQIRHTEASDTLEEEQRRLEKMQSLSKLKHGERQRARLEEQVNLGKSRYVLVHWTAESCV